LQRGEENCHIALVPTIRADALKLLDSCSGEGNLRTAFGTPGRDCCGGGIAFRRVDNKLERRYSSSFGTWRFFGSDMRRRLVGWNRTRNKRYCGV